MVIRDLVQNQVIVAIAKDLHSKLADSCTKCFYLEEGKDQVLVKCVKNSSYSSITIIPLASSGIIFHPRTGVFASMPIYSLDGNILPAYGVLGGGWFIAGSEPGSEGGNGGTGGGSSGGGGGWSGGEGDTPPGGGTPPPNTSATINNPDGSVLMDDNNEPILFA